MAHSPSYEQIRQLAHEIWEAQGCPEGRSAEHWMEAERRLAADGAAAEDSGEQSSAGGADAASRLAREQEQRTSQPPVETAIQFRGEANGSRR